MLEDIYQGDRVAASWLGVRQDRGGSGQIQQYMERSESRLIALRLATPIFNSEAFFVYQMVPVLPLEHQAAFHAPVLY